MLTLSGLGFAAISRIRGGSSDSTAQGD